MNSCNFGIPEIFMDSYFRYASSGVALFLTFIVLASTVWARLKLPRASQVGIKLLIVLTVLLVSTSLTPPRCLVIYSILVNHWHLSALCYV